MPLARFWLSRWTEVAALLEPHLVLVLLSTGLAVAIGLPLGIVAAKRKGLGRALLAFANIAQTVPSLALLGFLLPIPFIGGIGPRTALVALSVYALLPIVRTTVTGLMQVDPAVLATYAGRYEISPTFILTVRPDSGRLYIQATAQPEFEAYAESETEFFYRVVDAQISFTRPEGGVAPSLTLHQNGKSMPGKRLP